MKHPERQRVLDALDGLPDEDWLVCCSSMRGVNMVMANMIEDNPQPELVLEAALADEIKRLSGQ